MNFSADLMQVSALLIWALVFASALAKGTVPKADCQPKHAMTIWYTGSAPLTTDYQYHQQQVLLLTLLMLLLSTATTSAITKNKRSF